MRCFLFNFTLLFSLNDALSGIFSFNKEVSFSVSIKLLISFGVASLFSCFFESINKSFVLSKMLSGFVSSFSLLTEIWFVESLNSEDFASYLLYSARSKNILIITFNYNKPVYAILIILLLQATLRARFTYKNISFAIIQKVLKKGSRF